MSITEEELADMERLAEDGLEPYDIRRALKRACAELRRYEAVPGTYFYAADPSLSYMNMSEFPNSPSDHQAYRRVDN